MSELAHLPGEVYPDAVLNIDSIPASVFQLKRRSGGWYGTHVRRAN